MPSQHKHPPIPFRPPGPERDWLLKYAADNDVPVNSVLTEALREYRARVERETWQADLAEHS